MTTNSLKKLTDSEDKTRLIKNFISLLILRGFQFSLPLISLPYLVRTIGVDKFGMVNFATSFGMYFGAIIQFGFGITATRDIARNRGDPLKLSQLYSNTMSATILLSVVSAVFFTLIVFLFDKFNEHLNLYLFTLVFIVLQSLFPIWFFQGLEKMMYITFLNLGANILYLISIFFFIKKEEDFILVPLLNSIAALLSFIFAVFLIWKKFKVKFVLQDVKGIKSTFQGGWNAFVSQFAPNFYNNSAVFLLGIYSNNTTVGFYSAATKVVDAIISFSYILSNAFLPYLSRNLQRYKFFQRTMFAAGGVLTVITFLSAGLIAEFLSGINNGVIKTCIQYLSPSIFLVSASIAVGTNYLMLIGKENIVKNIALMVSLTFFIISFVLISFWGIWGAITTVVFARLTIMVANVYFIKTLAD